MTLTKMVTHEGYIRDKVLPRLQPHEGFPKEMIEALEKGVEELDQVTHNQIIKLLEAQIEEGEAKN